MKKKISQKSNIIFVCFIVIILFVGRFILSVGFATGESMEPTISSKSILLIDKFSKEYQRNDIIVFNVKGKRNITKRIIGLPGEIVTVNDDGLVFINNVQYEDIYGNITIPTLLDGNRSYPITLEYDEYFVMGDNRNVSNDSRFEEIGNVNEKNIIGEVMKYFSIEQQ